MWVQAELELHGVLYSVSVLVHGEEQLVVKIEDRDTLDAWHGEFAAKCTPWRDVCCDATQHQQGAVLLSQQCCPWQQRGAC